MERLTDDKELHYNKELVYLTEEQLPQKVAAICNSVIKLYNEGISIYKITVSEIAKEAGIGKGTVYEYFNDKEEVVITAMLLELKKQLKKICDIIIEKDTFEEKYNAVMGWIGKQIKQNIILRKMLLTKYSKDSDEATCQLISHFVNKSDADVVLDSIISSGVREGLFMRPQTELMVKSAFSTLALGVSITLCPEEFGNPTEKEIIEHCRNLFIKILR